MAEKVMIPAIRFDECHDAWEKHDVGEYYFFKNGLNKGKAYFGHGTPIVNFMDVFHNRGLLFQDLQGKVELDDKEIANFEVKKSDLFFTRTSETLDEIGFPSVMLDEPKNTVFSGFVLRGRAVSHDPLTDIFKRYVFFTKAFRNEMIKKSSMTTRALTSGTAIKEMLVRFPLFKSEQNKIGSFFVFLDCLIALHQREYSKIINIKKALLEKIFPKAGENKPEIRFSGFTDAWERRKLGDVAQSFDYGLNASAIKFDGQNKYLRITDIDDETHEFNFTDLTSPNIDFLRAENYILCETDVLFARTGASVGKTYRYRKSDGRVYFAGFLVRARIKPEYDVEFIFQNTLTTQYSRFIQMTSQRSGQPGVNAQEYGEYELFLPNMNEQKQISSLLSYLDKLVAIHQRELVKLQNMKKSLLEKMFV